ncbi:hypothetical protein CBR_g39669 [Chara braunii]|uniref:CCHC-type domain-containing protein n=1 Tax=Chara braunii TaxID=69332 RepID=A0A388K1G9_CHABU|nr:hypothetical protein CBR_g39669 [Chara braunii]|eukprot:GBG63888.1 hypothetical protein CBR_g39669 [Chara braunii]
MAGVPPNQGCFTCGSLHHWSRECPQRSHGFRPPATRANAIPTSTPLLALPAPNVAPAPAVNQAASGSAGHSAFSYQPRPRTNWWKDNQEQLDKVYNKFMEDEEKERRCQELEEKDRVKKEEETKRSEWKKERERLKAEISAKLDKRFEELGLKQKETQESKGLSDEVTRLRKENEELLRKIGGVASNYEVDDELARLKRKNEELRKRRSRASTSQDEDCVSRLQKEICELRKQVGSKQVESDEIFVLKQELGELKQSAYMKTNFEQEIVGLRREVDSLRRMNERAMEETKQWKDEALRPGNKRGSVVVDTPAISNRGNPKPRWTKSMKDDNRWKEEYKKLQGLHRVANAQAELLKEKRATAEVKRMEAEGQVKELEEKMSRLKAAEAGNERVGGGTNLKDRLEAMALGSARRGKKAMPGRGSSKEDQVSNEVNDRFQFVEEQKKQLRNLKKTRLELMCKEAGIRTEKVDQMVCELAEFRVEQAFGPIWAKDPASKGKQPVHVVEDDSEQRDVDTSEEGDERSVEL